MKRCICIFLFLFGVLSFVAAQDFITRGKIEFEMKFNNKRASADFDDGNEEGMPGVPATPDFTIVYRELLFIDNKWLYKQGRKSDSEPDDISENSLYAEAGSRLMVLKRRYTQDEHYVLSDTLPQLKWKIGSETRKIAGWECRKAITRFNDSVYVVAFYCPEIIPQAGPELFSGLPGMILGLAIPRYYTTWFATKVELANIDESQIVPPTAKKGKTYNKQELAEILLEKYKDAGWWEDVTKDKVLRILSSCVL